MFVYVYPSLDINQIWIKKIFYEFHLNDDCHDNMCVLLGKTI